MIFWYMYMLSNDEINTINLFITLNIYPFLPYGENILILLVILKHILDISRKNCFCDITIRDSGGAQRNFILEAPGGPACRRHSFKAYTGVRPLFFKSISFFKFTFCILAQ